MRKTKTNLGGSVFIFLPDDDDDDDEEDVYKKKFL
mgnify:CR=1 FL=1